MVSEPSALVPVGVCLPTEAVERVEITRCLAHIEASGADHVAVGEHVLSSGPSFNSFTLLSYAAALTERVRLVSAIALAPLYPAALLAKLAVTLDALSAGRFVLGVGAGGEVPAEFAACGVPRNERGARTDDAVRAVRALSGTAPATLSTPRFTLEGASFEPPPARRIPIWVAGRSDAAIRRAARFADAWYPYLVTRDQLAAGVEQLRTSAAELDVPTPRTVAYCFVNVGDDGPTAHADAVAFVAKRYGLDPARVERYVVAGDAEHCIARLRAMRDAGADELTVRFATPFDDFPRVLDRFAERVRPSLEA